MKQGRSFPDLVTEVQRQAKAKRDFRVTTRQLTVAANGNLTLTLPQPENAELESGPTDCPVLPFAQNQLATTFGIPIRYFQKLLTEQRGLLEAHLNGWFGVSKPDHRRLIRTLDGNVRAVLSDRYRIRDNLDLMEWLLPWMNEQTFDDGTKVVDAIETASSQITDCRLYLKLITQRHLKRTLRVGDEIEGGVVIGNSEVGDGSTYAYPFTRVLACSNGMTHTQHGQRKFHIGRRNGDSDDTREVFKDDTLKAEDKAFFLKFRDIVMAALSERVFNAICDSMDRAAGFEITGHVEGAWEVTRTQFGLTDEERATALDHFVRGGKMSLWGISQAVTRTAEDVESYDRASELEKTGGDILCAPTAQVRAICEAAKPA